MDAEVKKPAPFQGGSVRDVKPAKFIAAYAEHLKKANWIKLPAWVDLVKTGPSKQMCPADKDWYFIRAASIARKLYLHGKRGVGVGLLRKIYGTSKHRGPAPNRFYKAAGGLIRHIVKQFVEIGVFEKDPEGGRKISKEGIKDLDRIASRVLRGGAYKEKKTKKEKKIKKKEKEAKAKLALEKSKSLTEAQKAKLEIRRAKKSKKYEKRKEKKKLKRLQLK